MRYAALAGRTRKFCCGRTWASRVTRLKSTTNPPLDCGVVLQHTSHMKERQQPDSDRPVRFNLTFRPDQYMAVSNAALKARVSMAQYVRDAALEKASGGEK